MTIYGKRAHLIVAMLIGGAIASGCQDQGDASDKAPSGNPVINTAKGVIDSTKEKAEDLVPDVVDWTAKDIKSIGDWEYKIVRFEDTTDEALEQSLNELGSERWECYWVEEVGKGSRYHFKRTKRSYLRYIPVGDMLRLVTPEGGPG